jgi:hypothetical protein
LTNAVLEPDPADRSAVAGAADGGRIAADVQGTRPARVPQPGTPPRTDGQRQRAIGLGLGLDDPQAIDTEQCGSDILGQVPAAFWVIVSLSKIRDLKKPWAS